MINTAVTITGWIQDAHVRYPQESWEDGNYKYRLQIHPEDYGTFEDIEHRIEELKKYNPPEHNPDVEARYENRDHLFDGATVVFETLRKPTLYGDIRNTQDDYDFVGKYVRVLGNLKLHKDGNAYITFHLIEEMSKDYDLPEVDIDDDDDDIW